MPHLNDGLEPEAKQQFENMGPDAEMSPVYLHSIAISLKRIADALEEKQS